MTTEGKGAAAPRPSTDRPGWHAEILTEREAQDLLHQVQEGLLEMSHLVHEAHAEVAKLKAENAMLSAALALLEKGKAA